MRARSFLLGAALAILGAQATLTAETPKMTDEQTEALARQAMATADPNLQRTLLLQLEAHRFKNNLAKERETVLFAEGMIQDHLGETARAAVTLRKLVDGWPGSPFVPEAQVVLAQSALDHGRNLEAESRLNTALAAEIPTESLRRAQELMLWCLAEQGRAKDGLPIVKALRPLGTAKPSERGLVGILEALAAGGERAQAEGVYKDYTKLYPQGPHRDRVSLDWGKLLGTAGDAKGAAQVFDGLIKGSPASPEADEARMALATLLSDGSLPPKDAQGYPDAQALLARVKKSGAKDEATRKALMLNLRIALKESRWLAALEAVDQFRATRPDPGQAKPVAELRGQAVRGLAAEALEKKDPLRLLPYLDGETILALTAAQRLEIARGLAAKGLPEASRALIHTAPSKEQTALTRATLEALGPGTDPQGTLALLPAKGETAPESLLRAQAAVALQQWPEARAALGRAKPGPGRIQALLAYLRRPLGDGEKPEARAKDIDAWLAKAPEKGEDREPLALLSADHKTREGDWKAALALYPAHPSAANRGWVALMRATCQARLGKPDLALATLKEAEKEPAFQKERAFLEKRLAM